MSRRKIPTLQQWIATNNVTRDPKQIRRSLRAKFKNTHEHNARWTVTKAVEKHLREFLKMNDATSAT